MKQLRYLIPATLYVSTIVRNEIGDTIESLEMLQTYQVYSVAQSNEIQSHDDGATIKNVYRISSVRNELELFLLPLMKSESDNASKYKLYVNDKMCSIKTVKDTYLDVTYV